MFIADGVVRYKTRSTSIHFNHRMGCYKPSMNFTDAEIETHFNRIQQESKYNARGKNGVVGPSGWRDNHRSPIYAGLWLLILKSILFVVGKPRHRILSQLRTDIWQKDVIHNKFPIKDEQYHIPIWTNSYVYTLSIIDM